VSATYPGERYFPRQPWLAGWARWDAGWYREIAEYGYSLVPGRQSTVAFFPAYPLAMRALGALLGNTLVAGIVLTAVAGLTAAGAFWAWCSERLSPAAAWTALALVLVYPYAYYLYGAVYADAMFIAAGLGAFVLLEHDRPWLAGLAGAVATAARPLGVVVAVGLVARALERREVFSHRRPRRLHLDRLRAKDAGVLVALAGLAAYCAYLAVHFDDPFAFATVEQYWGQGAGPRTWFKVEFFENITNLSDRSAWLAYVAHPLVTVVALALVVRVFRRFGWGYGVYSLLAVGLAAVATKDFFGMGRYVLAAFPCFAVAGELLADRPRLRAGALAASGAGLVVMTSFFARGSYLS
jgi:Gpi18-like mannosyltransferase